jgi:integrase
LPRIRTRERGDHLVRKEPTDIAKPGARRRRQRKQARAREKLTVFTLENLKPAAKGTRYTAWDSEVPGLGVRVTDKGVRTFIVMRRLSGQKNPVRFALGTYPDMKLAQARNRADEVRQELKAGVHPREKRERREQARRRQDTFAAVAEEFLQQHAKKLRTFREIEIVVRRDLISRWGKRPITDITRLDVVKLVREIIARGEGKRRGSVSYAAHHALAHARLLFNWVITQDIYKLDASPCALVSAKKLIGAKEKRKRVLSDPEIRLVWQAAGSLGYPFAQLIRLLLVTGQRRDEVAGAEWREVESLRVVEEGEDRRVDASDAVWTIPKERMKGGITHEVPLSSVADELFASIPRFQGGAFMFTTTGGRRPVSGFSKIKLKLDRAMRKMHRRALGVPEDDEKLRKSLVLAASEPLLAGYQIEPWQFHDLRRTMRTRLSGLKDARGLPIPDEVRELMIAHRRPDLHQIYDQHSYRDEKRRGFELWAARLLEIVKPLPADGNSEVGKPLEPENGPNVISASTRRLRSRAATAPDRPAAVQAH